MAEYMIQLPGDEGEWERATPEERAATYRRHEEFARALAERGHRVAGGAELAHSRTAKTVRVADGGEVLVSDGPYAETIEQLTGYYLVESDDVDDLAQVCALLGGVIEIRPLVPSADAGGVS